MDAGERWVGAREGEEAGGTAVGPGSAPDLSLVWKWSGVSLLGYSQDNKPLARFLSFNHEAARSLNQVIWAERKGL